MGLNWCFSSSGGYWFSFAASKIHCRRTYPCCLEQNSFLSLWRRRERIGHSLDLDQNHEKNDCLELSASFDPISIECVSEVKCMYLKLTSFSSTIFVWLVGSQQRSSKETFWAHCEALILYSRAKAHCISNRISVGNIRLFSFRVLVWFGKNVRESLTPTSLWWNSSSIHSSLVYWTPWKKNRI